MASRPWQDGETLREKYVNEQRSSHELADEWGCCHTTVLKWVKRHGIQTRGDGGSEVNAPYRDEETLRELHIEQGLNIHEIADKFDTSYKTIWKWMDKLGVEHNTDYSRCGPDPKYDEKRPHAESYEYVYENVDGQIYIMKIHRLVAYAHGMLDGDELFDYDRIVHHKDRNKWVNSPENLEVLSRTEHGLEHVEDRQAALEYWD